jgi:hypothetical protein
MILRLAGLALLASVGLSALLGYAASFSIDPVVSQELVIAVEDVTTTTSGGPAEAVEEEIPYLVGNGAVAIAPPLAELGCSEAGPEAVDPCAQESEPESAEAEEKPAGPAEKEPDIPGEEPDPYANHDGFAWILTGG